MPSWFALSILLPVLLTAVPDCLCACNPPCRNGGTCTAKGICQCPTSSSGLSCELPALPYNILLEDEFSIINGTVFNWKASNASILEPRQPYNSIRLLESPSSIPNTLWSKTDFTRSYHLKYPTIFIHGLVEMSNDTNSGSVLAVLLAGADSITSTPRYGTSYQYGVDEAKFSGFAFIFDSRNGSAYAIFSGRERLHKRLSSISSAFPSQCIGNLGNHMKGRFAFEIRLNKMALSITISNWADQPIKCVQNVSVTSAIYIDTNTFLRFGLTSFCGEGTKGTVTEIAELRFYSTTSLNCPIPQLSANFSSMFMFIPAIPGTVIPRNAKGSFICPLETLASLGNKSYLTRKGSATCLPYDNYKFKQIDGYMACLPNNGQVCDPSCKNAGVCRNGTCICPSPTLQPPNCKFDARFLPAQAVAFFSMTPDSYAYESDERRYFIDKSGSPLKPIATFGSGVKFCYTCIVVTNNGTHFHLDMPCLSGNGGAISVSFPESRSTQMFSDVTTFLFFYLSSAPATHIFTWKNNASLTSELQIGVDSTNYLFLRYNGSASNQGNIKTTISTRGVTSLSPYAITLDHLENTIEISNYKNASHIWQGHLPNFIPPGPGDGESIVFSIPATSKAQNLVWCFGAFHARLTPADAAKYYDACFYDFGAISKAPALLASVSPNSAVTLAGTIVSNDPNALGTETAIGEEFSTPLLTDEISSWSNTASWTEIQVTTEESSGNLSESTTSTASSSKITETTPKVPTLLEPLPKSAETEYEVLAWGEVDGIITLSDGTVLDTTGVWNDALNDRNSELFNLTVKVFLPVVETVFREETSWTGVQAAITGFRQGSIISDYIVTLRTLTDLSESQIQEKVDEVLKRLRSGLAAAIGSIRLSQLKSVRVLKATVKATKQPASKTAAKSRAMSTYFGCGPIFAATITLAFALP